MRALTNSMTGYGSATGSVSGRAFQIELRSVNHRFLDLKIRIPRDFAPIESKFRTTLQAHLQRGAVECRFEWVRTGNTTSSEVIRIEEAKRAIASLVELRALIPELDPPLSVSEVLMFPGIFTPKSKEEDASFTQEPQGYWAEIESTLLNALSQFQGARSAEGAELRVSLLEKTRGLKAGVSVLAELRNASLEAATLRLRERMEKIFLAHPIEGSDISVVLESRVAQELSFLADRLDVDEELTRLSVHLDRFENLLEKGGVLGKKLEFMLQEIHRELTTLGNKAQDLSMSETLVDLKTLTEQIREQVMNIE